MEMIQRGLALFGRSRDFATLMGTQFLAQAGDGIVQAAIGKAITFGDQKGFDIESARSPDEVLRIALYIFIPYTVVSPFLGVIIDRWDRRRLLFVANGLRAVVVALVALAGTGDVGDVPLFLAFVLTLASTRIVLATKAAALPAALEDRSLVEGNAVSQLGGAMFQIGGAGFALVATSVVDADPVVLIGAVVYGAGALLALWIKRAGEPRAASTWLAETKAVAGNIVAGVREVARTPQAGASITTYFWLRLLWSFSIVGIGFIARDLLEDKEAVVLIVTGGAGAAGAVLGFLLANRLLRRVSSIAQLVLAASAVAGIAVTLLGSFEFGAALAVLTFFLGFGFFLAKISLDTMVQEALGDDFRGRAFSLYDISYNGAWVLAAAIMKLLWSDDLQGPLIAAMGIVFLAGMGLIGAWFKRAGLLQPAPAAEVGAHL
ncbi:MAG: MFS transporter [Actinomycetota bacterium]